MNEKEFDLIYKAFEKEFPLDSILSAARSKHNLFRRMEIADFLERIKLNFILERIEKKMK